MKHTEALKQFKPEEQEIIKRFLALVIGRPKNENSLRERAGKIGITPQALWKREQKDKQ